MNDPRYPIGKVQTTGSLQPQQRAAAIAAIAELPFRLHDAVRGLDQHQLDTPYREGGWMLRQVVHHIADSHVNAYVRHKLVATEQDPPIKAYDENAWARLADANGAIGVSLQLVQAVHERWVTFLRSLPADAFARAGMHSERGRLTLDDLLATYAWHGAHHVAHITSLRAAKNW